MVLANGSSPYPFYKLFAFCSPRVNGNHYALIDKSETIHIIRLSNYKENNYFVVDHNYTFFFNEIFNSTQEDLRFEIS